MSATVTVNGLRVVWARFVLPYIGVWFADLHIDPTPALAATVPLVGPAVISVGETPPQVLRGVIDPLASGTFGPTVSVRVVGGLGGWARSVPAQHFPATGLPTSQIVYAATGAIVGEVCTVTTPPIPYLLGYSRSAGPASRVLQDELWWLDPILGVTFVALLRPPSIPDPSLTLLDWDPVEAVARCSCDALVLPGTPIVDLRLGAKLLFARDVEQVIDMNGSVATVQTSTNPVNVLRAGLQTMVREFGRSEFMRVAQYSYVAPGPPGPTGAPSGLLQAVDRSPLTGLASPYPDLAPQALSFGVPGIQGVPPPGLGVYVGFVDGTAQPLVLGYSALALPLTLTLDAVTLLSVGKTAVQTIIGGPVGQPLMTATALTALETFATGLASITPPTNPATTQAAVGTIIGLGVTLASALGVPACVTIKLKGA